MEGRSGVERAHRRAQLKRDGLCGEWIWRRGEKERERTGGATATAECRVEPSSTPADAAPVRPPWAAIPALHLFPTYLFLDLSDVLPPPRGSLRGFAAMQLHIPCALFLATSLAGRRHAHTWPT